MTTRWSVQDEGPSDEALLAGMVIGDEEAGVTFVRRYQRRVFGLALSVVNDPGLAEDVAQEAFLRVFRHAAAFDLRRGTVPAWVLTITRNLAIDAVRLRRAVPTAPDDPVWYELASPTVAPDDAATQADAVSKVKGAIRELPVEQRRALVLATIYGRTATEIAHIEAIPLGTAKSRIRMGMSKVRSAVTFEDAG